MIRDSQPLDCHQEADAPDPCAEMADRPASPGAPRPLTVTEVAKLVSDALAAAVPASLRVVGEISNFSNRQHWYLSLKDEQSVISCVMWASAARRCGFLPQQGQQVVATGRLDFYGPQGRLQLYIEKLEPVGQGVLELRFRQLCDALRSAGYFDEARKKSMPVFPRHLAVVTSAAGAALQDVIRTARQRWAGIRLSVYDVRVQGEGAAAEIAGSIALIDQQHRRLGIDAVILTRGGGSMEDLWAFNERIVADAIYRCRVPIAVGVGHETDTTIAELVADLRCSTPTQAAARLVPDRAAETHRLDQWSARLLTTLSRRVQHEGSRLAGCANHAIFRRPLDRFLQIHQQIRHDQTRLGAAMRERLAMLRQTVAQHTQTLGRIEPHARMREAGGRIDELAGRLARSQAQSLRLRSLALNTAAMRLRAVGPVEVLKRGFTYTTTSTGQLIKSVSLVRPGEVLSTHFHDGQVESQVRTSVISSPIKPPPRKVRRQAAADANQGELFSK